MRRLVRCLSAALLGACGPTPPEPGATATATGTSSSSSTSSHDASGPVTTTGEPRLDLPPVTPEAACAALCETSAACSETTVDPECVEWCVDGLGHGSGNKPGCIEADAVLTACRATLPCDVLQDEGGYRACDRELRAMLTACRLCHGLAGWIDQDTCFNDNLCPDGLERIECDAQSCVCTFEGEVLAVCPGGCDPDGLPSSGYACCP